MFKKTWKRFVMVGLVALLMGNVIAWVEQPVAWGSNWVVGDVFVATLSDGYEIYNNAGLFKETISDGILDGSYSAGCSFNPSLSKLYTTDFTNTKVIVYKNAHPHGILQVVDTGAASPDGNSESLVFDASGKFYVGHAYNDTLHNKYLHKYDAAGNLLATYNPAVERQGVDWIDLAADQRTMFYTSEGARIMRFDVATNTQLPDFANLDTPGLVDMTFALRLLPPGDGSGGLLVTHVRRTEDQSYFESDIKRLDGNGHVVKTYSVPGADFWFSLALDPNGTSFWAGDGFTGNIYRFNIFTGAVEAGPIATTGPLGICLKGEPTAALLKQCRMTGGGYVIKTGNQKVEHGFTLRCDAGKGPNNLEVNWGKGNKFHLESLTSALCTDNPAINPEHPKAGFDTYTGSGVGRFNGVTGATAEWTFIDGGEPGKNDYAKIVIKDAGGTVKLDISGYLQSGNHQAHDQCGSEDDDEDDDHDDDHDDDDDHHKKGKS